MSSDVSHLTSLKVALTLRDSAFLTNIRLRYPVSVFDFLVSSLFCLFVVNLLLEE